MTIETKRLVCIQKTFWALRKYVLHVIHYIVRISVVFDASKYHHFTMYNGTYCSRDALEKIEKNCLV